MYSWIYLLNIFMESLLPSFCFKFIFVIEFEVSLHSMQSVHIFSLLCQSLFDSIFGPFLFRTIINRLALKCVILLLFYYLLFLLIFFSCLPELLNSFGVFKYTAFHAVLTSCLQYYNIHIWFITMYWYG